MRPQYNRDLRGDGDVRADQQADVAHEDDDERPAQHRVTGRVEDERVLRGLVLRRVEDVQDFAFYFRGLDGLVVARRRLDGSGGRVLARDVAWDVMEFSNRAARVRVRAIILRDDMILDPCRACA